jgi:stearoyl-CoA desaturase (delta-9 desaturase)
VTWSATVAGLWHAHVGWMFDNTTTDPDVYAPDLKADRVAQRLTQWYWELTFLSLAVPTAIGWAFGGPRAALDSLLLAGCVRTTVLHNLIWAVNSIGHTWGSRPSTTHNESRNNVFLALATFGEGWHNNHHAAPRCAYNGWRRYEVDFNGALIRILAWLRIVWAVNGRPRSGSIAHYDDGSGVNARRSMGGGHMTAPTLNVNVPVPVPVGPERRYI